MKFLKYFKTPFLKYFMKFLIFNIKWLKTFKNMIKVYQVSRRYIMLIMHNNKYLPLTGLLTLLQWTIQPIQHGTACRDRSTLTTQHVNDILHGWYRYELLYTVEFLNWTTTQVETDFFYKPNNTCYCIGNMFDIGYSSISS